MFLVLVLLPVPFLIGQSEEEQVEEQGQDGVTLRRVGQE